MSWNRKKEGKETEKRWGERRQRSVREKIDREKREARKEW